MQEELEASIDLMAGNHPIGSIPAQPMVPTAEADIEEGPAQPMETSGENELGIERGPPQSSGSVDGNEVDPVVFERCRWLAWKCDLEDDWNDYVKSNNIPEEIKNKLKKVAPG